MNSITIGRTSKFRIIPELREKFDQFVESLRAEGEPSAEWTEDGRVALLDIGDFQYEDANEEIREDGLEQLLPFLLHGQAVFYVWAGYTGLQWVGGGAAIGYKDDDGICHQEWLSTHRWLRDKMKMMQSAGFECGMPCIDEAAG